MRESVGFLIERNLVLYGTDGFLGVFAFSRLAALCLLLAVLPTLVSPPPTPTMADPQPHGRPPDPGSRTDSIAGPTEVAPRLGQAYISCRCRGVDKI